MTQPEPRRRSRSGAAGGLLLVGAVVLANSGFASGSAAVDPAAAAWGSAAPAVAALPPAGFALEGVGTAGPGAVGDTIDGAGPAWRMPPMRTAMPMLPSLKRLAPDVDPFLPLEGVPADSLPPVRPRELLRLADGDSITLRATPVRKQIRGRTFKMWGYNGQIPGPLLEVPQGAEIVVTFRNGIELPSTIHWHGLRLDNRFDGVPGVTQEPVAPGESFVYRVRFPDAGIYWYHPHVREDVEQDLGLYGNMLVRPSDEDAYGPVHREEVLTLDDLLVDDGGLFPWGRQASVQTLMGRFGNVFLVNGTNEWRTEVRAGEVVRFYLTNVANTRTFNLRLGDVPMKLVAADLGRFERETRVGHVAIAPAQRYVVEARFAEPGTVALTNSIQAIDHYRGEFYPQVDTLGLVRVSGEPVEEDLTESFHELREHGDVQAQVDPYRSWGDRAPDRELVLTVEGRGLPLVIRRMMELDTLYSPPVEWNDAMPMMNYVSTGRRMTWKLEDPATGAVNMDIGWRFRVGQRVKLRLRNPETSIHPMQHPIHLHGQRLLVLARDGVPNENMVWKDTAVVPVGSTVDLLVEFSNPGDWMLHCHISEHLESGMKTVFHVAPTEEAEAP